MGENEGSAEAGRPLANGLLPGAGHVMTALDTERWSRAEERTAELISCIQPNQISEERRNAVADYVQRLIMKCFPCQVCTFGSVPLKTYLPDGDIDLTAFSHDQNLKDTWANQVRDMLENEEKNEKAEFHVKEVQYIQAEVKIIKCLVENIIVDISFNQVGGLCTLCFLDEVDSLIKQNHLFKRSIILIKAWCYYESRILGAHHGLISTYALETLVLYIFHVFNNSFHGPLEVLYRFLEFFSNFDWDNFCVSLWGPVPISSLPDGIAEPPRNDSGELLLSKLFLDACSSVYAVFPGGQENNGQPFVSKHFNVIDPLRVNNNLGRSVSKGNFFRIRSAFAFGAKKLARLLDCPKENLIFEVNQFFMNTWKRHGSGNRPDVPSVSSQHGKVSSRMMPPTNELSPFPNMQSSRSQNKNSLQATDSSRRAIASAEVLQNDLKSDARFLFARTRSSPELTDAYGDGDVSSQVRRSRETKTTNRKKNLESESSLPSADVASDSNNGSSSYRQDSHLDSLSEEYSSAEVMHNEEQDLVNLMGSASLQGFNRHLNGPFNLNTAHMPFSIPPSLIASMAYTHQNHPGFFPTNTPLIDPSFVNMQFPHGMVSPQFTHYFPGIGMNSPSENSFDRSSDNFGSAEMKSEELDNDFWPEQNVGPSNDSENGNTDIIQSEDKDKPPSISGLKYVPPPRMAASRGQQKHTREKRGSLRQNSGASPIHENRNSDAYSEERSVSSRFSSAAHSNSFRSRTSSESSWDGSSVKTPKSAKEKRGKKISSTNLGKGKSVSEHAPNQAEEDDQECVSLSNVGKELVERNSFSEPLAALQVPRMLIDHGSRQRIDDSSELIFYPTGPAIPFVTMLPLYNVPPETGTSNQSSSRFEGDETTENNEGYNHSDDLNISSSSFRGTSSSETSEDKKPDILNSDFLSHWQNLQFGRYCQNPRSHGPLLYPSPVMVPPAYLQGRFPYENPGRPFPTNKNLFSQLMTSYGQRVVPLAPIQSVSSRPAGPYQPYIDDMPRYRSGTGTYLPNHNQKIPNRDQHSSGTRRGSYNHDRSGDSYGEREGGNWNANSKPRASSSRSRQPNSRADHSASSDSQADRPWNTSSGQNMAYRMYPLDPNGASSGPSGPPLMMLYPFDHNATYTPQGEQLEFGSLGPIGIKDQLPQHRHHRSSPDRPSSSHHQR